MKILRTVVLSLSAALCAPAQNLVGVDFESSAAITTANWQLQTASNTFAIDTTDQHCGTASARVDVATNWCEFGKQWYFHTGITETLQARVRIKAPASTGGQLRLAAEALAYPVTNWNLAWIDANHLAGSTDIDASLSAGGWQTFELSYTPPTGSPPTGPTLVRLWFIAINLSGKSFFVDSVDFTGSGSAYAGGVAMEQTSARAVTSTRLTMVYDSSASTKRVRDLRNTRPNTPANIAADQPAVLFDENLLRDLPHASGLNAGSDLYKISYRATVTTPDPANWAASRWHSLSSVAASPVGTGWRFSQAGNGITAQVDMYTLPNRAEIFLDPVVTRPATAVLEAFMCPWLEMATTSDGDNTDSRCIQPSAGGVLVPTDSTFFNGMPGATRWMAEEYPGGAALQLIGVYDNDAGAALASYDTTGENKLFLAHALKASSSCELSIFHRVPSLTGTSAPIANVQRAILPCVGTWQDAADQYRDWIDGTSLWTAAVNRSEATWVAGRPTIFEADLTPQGMGAELVPLDDWHNLMDDWASHLGGEMVPLFRGFEQNGIFAGPVYTPLRVFATDPLGSTTYTSRRTESEIHQEWNKVQTHDHHGMVMIAGLKWAKSRVGDYDPRWITSTNTCSTAPNKTSSYWVPTLTAPAGTPWAGLVIQERTPAGVIQDLLVTAGAGWDTDHYFMDPQLANTLNVHKRLANQVGQNGIHVYLFDQMNGGRVADHFGGSTNGAGAWKVASIRKLFGDTLAAGRNVNSDFELAIEDPCEQAIDSIALQGTRPTAIRRWPASPNYESRSVPMFQYVFSQVISPITWDIPMPTATTFATWSAPSTLRQTCYWQFATILASGSWLATNLHPWMLVRDHATACSIANPTAMEPTWSAADTDVRNFLAGCVATSQGPAATFLNDGSMVQTSTIVAPGSPIGTSTIYEEQWSYTTPRSEPRIVHAAWQIPGSTARAVLFGNIDQATAQTVLVPVTVGTATVGIGDAIQRFDNGGTATIFGYTANHTISVPARTVTLLVY